MHVRWLAGMVLAASDFPHISWLLGVGRPGGLRGGLPGILCKEDRDPPTHVTPRDSPHAHHPLRARATALRKACAPQAAVHGPFAFWRRFFHGPVLPWVLRAFAGPEPGYSEIKFRSKFKIHREFHNQASDITFFNTIIIVSQGIEGYLVEYFYLMDQG